MTRLCFKSAEPTAGATTGGKYATHCLPNALAPPCPMPHDAAMLQVGRAAQRTGSPMPHAPLSTIHYPLPLSTSKD
ncbi:MAG: hypothetical protein KME31_08860 [Tolypothrix carrinoi HA7290-LM1]|nr:hypothetical protein [Tolypothrix carrinoi HA7290-LM1]